MRWWQHHHGWPPSVVDRMTLERAEAYIEGKKLYYESLKGIRESRND